MALIFRFARRGETLLLKFKKQTLAVSRWDKTIEG